MAGVDSTEPEPHVAWIRVYGEAGRGYWAEVDGWAGYTAVGDSLDELLQLVAEGIAARRRGDL